MDEKHPLVRTFFIPSSLLRSHNLEILIHIANGATEPSSDLVTHLLVPAIDIRISGSGRLSTVTYPVHKALIYGEGIKNLSTFAAVEKESDQREEGRVLQGVLDCSWTTARQELSNDQAVSLVNLALAETAIEAFRESSDKSLEYEHLWYDAGMPALSAWLIEGSGQSGSVKPAVRRLIKILCQNASREMKKEAAVKLQQETAATVSDTTKHAIQQAISIWAQMAHTELRDRLEIAFDSKGWRKIKWWRLIWRADDVGYTVLNIIRRAWLVDAEKEMIWMCGRIYQSGLLGPPRLRLTPAIDLKDKSPKLGSVPFSPDATDIILPASTFEGPLTVRQPWLQDISRARSTLASLTVPPLQALSQTLLLQTLLTNVLASSFAGLIYLSVSTISPYESGAVAATGLVYSLRRLQTRWESVRAEWETRITEEGRRVLRCTEDAMREGAEGLKPQVNEVEIEERTLATNAVEDIEKALVSLGE